MTCLKDYANIETLSLIDIREYCETGNLPTLETGLEDQMHWVVRTFIALMLVSALALGGAGYLITASLPDYWTDQLVHGLKAEITILRTDHAIPHIFGTDDRDIFFGLGFAHAQDRFWQMEVMRRTAAGRLSEVFGARTLRTDELLRRMDLYGAAVDSLPAQSDYTVDVLESYSAGINAFINNRGSIWHMAPEFLIFPIEVEPWTPSDSLAILKLLALQLASHVDREVTRARVSMAVPPERLMDILPDSAHKGTLAMPDYAALFPGLSPHYRASSVSQQSLSLPGQFGGWSSNAWAVGPSRSASGVSLLANDPHFNFTAPSFWYLARLELSTGGIVGGSIPGIPAILSGQGKGLAWGITAANMDDQDVFMEKLNPENSDQVLTSSGFRTLRGSMTVIKVKGGDPVELQLRWSENGPIIPASFYNLGEVTPEGHIATISRTLFDRSDTSMTAVLDLMKSSSVDQAISAMESFVTPAQNLHLIDREHVALQVIGKMPHRVLGNETLGRMPSRGWKDENRWHGYLPYSENPRVVDPKSGVVGNTNSKTTDRPFPFHVSFDWGDRIRIRRLQQLLGGIEKHDVKSFSNLQNDAVSIAALETLPFVIASMAQLTELQSAAIDLLEDWDANMDADRPEPLIFVAWMRFLQMALARNGIGELAKVFTHADMVFIDRVFQDENGASVWCDASDTSVVETCGSIALSSLASALSELGVADPAAVKNLQWGDLHVAVHVHPVLGELPILGRLVNIRHPSDGGDSTLLRARTRGPPPRPYEDAHGAAYRGIYNLGAPQASKFVLATGQAGHPLSRHYRDLARIWSRGAYVQALPFPDSNATNTYSRTRLSPRF